MTELGRRQQEQRVNNRLVLGRGVRALFALNPTDRIIISIIQMAELVRDHRALELGLDPALTRKLMSHSLLGFRTLPVTAEPRLWSQSGKSTITTTFSRAV